MSMNLKKAFDSVETEVVMEALVKKGIPTQYMKMLPELCSDFLTINIYVKREIRQGDAV